MSAKKLGTLVVIAVRARNLISREVFGKGNPYATFRIGDKEEKIPPHKKGGQRPEWDKEVRFELFDVSHHKKMIVKVFSDKLIGDTTIDLDKVLTNGEWDEWHEIRYRNKYVGEIRLEMTFYTTGETFQPSQITILRYPGVLHQHLLYFAKYIIEQSTIPLIDNPQMTFECCDINDVARSCCHILYCPPQRHGGKEYKITGPNLLTIDEIGSKASLGLGCDIKIKLMPVNQLKQVLMDLTADNKLTAYLLELWGLQGYLGISHKLQVTRDLELITGGGGSNLREFFENNKIAFNQQE
ncbi:9294_t:CDS:2 [Entrophospora sp. SA101]|nr:9294_t:CDS:2 [Entrophospora sp. SA101]